MHFRPSFFGILSLCACCLLVCRADSAGPAAGASHLVISEIYGGGGNSGAFYTHDFIELYNPTSSAVEMTNWSVQYQSGGGSGPFGSRAVFSGTVPAHGFFLIQANPGSGGTEALPPPDAVAGFSLAATSGKVALSSDSVQVEGPFDSSVVDFVGYGSANLYEGTGPAPGAGNTSSIERKAGPASDAASMGEGGAEEFDGNGYDTGENAVDFIARPGPGPQNTLSEKEHPGGSVSIGVGYGGRWNLVSIPLGVPDAGVSALFPGALTPFYSFSGAAYQADTEAMGGRGYWIKLPGPDTVRFEGPVDDPDTIVLESGWNLVGPGSSAISADQIGELPPGHLKSGFYHYDGGYIEAPLLEPGRGYWVRSSGGSIVLGAAQGGETRTQGAGQGPRLYGIRLPARDVPPPPPGIRQTGTVTRAGGMSGQVRITPNPFNPRTTIWFETSGPGDVKVAVADITGREVAVLTEGPLGPGVHSVVWDISGGSGREIASGVYFVHLRGPGFGATGKVLVVK